MNDYLDDIKEMLIILSKILIVGTTAIAVVAILFFVLISLTKYFGIIGALAT